jgi:outer membrane protein OmpA-like peptidoglycan-associated protein
VRPAGAVQLGGYTTSGTSVAQVFAEKIAQSSATVTTLPTHMGFQQGTLPTATAPVVSPQGSLMLPAGSPAPSFAAAQTQVGSSPSPAPTMARAGQLRVPVRAGGPAGGPFVVKFEHGSAQIGEPVRARLKAMADEQKARGGTIVVVGHASSRTRNLPVDKHKLANFGISLDRAQAVARELMRMGVAPQAIAVEARGDSDPIYHESMPAGEAENRRVEVFLHS